MRLSVAFTGFAALPPTVQVVRAAEDAGLDGVWTAEHIGFHDGIVPSAAYLRETDRIQIGIVGLSTATRHPGMTAMTLLSLSEFGPGRIRVAVGTGDAGLVGKLGKQINRPALNAKAFVLALRGAMAGRDMKEAHDEFSFDNFRVNPLAPAPPIDLMGIRTRMVTTAAQVADGLSISIGASLEYLRDTVALAEKELAAAGRDRSSFRITALTIGVITDDLDAGRAPIPALIAMAPQDSAAYLARGAIDAEALLEAERSGGPFAVMKQWTPDAIDRTALVCRPDALADKLAEFADTGIDELGVILLNDADQQPALIRMLAAARP